MLLEDILSRKKNRKRMTVVTPSMRPENLLRVAESIDLDYLDAWIIAAIPAEQFFRVSKIFLS